jgi:membrane peptidoglycan carboxypeptidase
MFKKIICFILILFGFFIAITVGSLLWLIVWSPGRAISPENIEGLLAMESPVYYRDGQQKVGVFFEQAHRQYVPYGKVPKTFVDALIAAEDHDFFLHHGVDYFGVLRAMVSNLKAGRVVQGGSTITQQTAKNLFKRSERSMGAKLKELLNAWRLEYHYPKEKILEFYVNQFYVSGNGRGIGVAARYYFDKEVSELDILESAFIAGSVKRPNYYNPFIKRDEEAAAAARLRAKERAAYVLSQMYKLEMISVSEYQANVTRNIPFRQGQMTYSLNTVMDLVKAGLDEPEVEEALRLNGIENVATSGIRVITTIEKDLQDSAFYALRKELSHLDVRLRGYDNGALQQVYEDLPYGNEQEKKTGGFLVGKIVGIEPAPGLQVAVSFDREGTVHGRIDQAGLMNMAEPLARYLKHAWSEAEEGDLKALLAQLGQGELVFVSIRGIDSFTGQYLLDLEKYPVLQGAVLALKEGTIRAMAGGMDNRYYNRAITAKRSMGSVIKPLVYLAAVQLGWNTLDMLNNQRNVFVFQNRPYFPRPDHHSPHKEVSMSWAGVYSENLASVWLLYHLCDRLVPVQFYELMDQLDLGQRPGESYQLYRARVRDELGIVATSEALREAAFEKAVVAIEADLLFDGKFEEYETLKNFHYGNGFDTFLTENEEEIALAEKEGKKDDLEEAWLRREILRKNFLRFMDLKENLERLVGEISADYQSPAPYPSALQPGRIFYDRGREVYIYAEELPDKEWVPVSHSELRQLLARRSLPEQERFWREIQLDGLLTPETMDLLQENSQKEYEKLADLPPYGKEVLYSLRDFRVYAGLRYLTGLCRELGIVSDLEPVLSFPLGSNVISVFEAAKAYEVLGGGRVYQTGSQGSEESLAIIERVEDMDGTVIYEPRKNARQVVDPKISLAVGDILRNVVRFGTGRYARRTLRLHSHDPLKEEHLQALDLPVPVYGKTGTANRFTNAAFTGLVPGMEEDGILSLGSGYVLAAYVGFDDNTPMVHKTTRLTGASGALPLWVRLAGKIFKEKDYAGSLDVTDLTFSGAAEIPLRPPDLGQILVPVDDDRGGVPLVVRNSGDRQPGKPAASVLTFGKITPGGEVEKTRYFQPYWQIKEDIYE